MVSSTNTESGTVRRGGAPRVWSSPHRAEPPRIRPTAVGPVRDRRRSLRSMWVTRPSASRGDGWRTRAWRANTVTPFLQFCFRTACAHRIPPNYTQVRPGALPPSFGCQSAGASIGVVDYS